ncbi:MAG: 50S ribosomal protein L28 [Elusimicrobiota bacterium]
MSKKCIVCNKGTTTGNKVSKSNKRSRRIFKSNLQKVNIIVEGRKTKAYVCTRCLKSNKVKKAI